MTEPMTAHALARVLLTRADYPVYLETETQIAPLQGVEIDAFDTEEGFVVVLVADLDD